MFAASHLSSNFCCGTLQTTGSCLYGQGNITHLTVLPSVTQGTYTSVCAQAVHTRPFVQARMRITLINFHEAEGSCKSHRTLAGKRIDAIHAGTTIETGAAGARAKVLCNKLINRDSM